MFSSVLLLLLLLFQLAVFLYFITTNGAYTVLTILSLKDLNQQTFTVTSDNISTILADTFYRPLSIITPTCNEAATLVASVQSLLALNYPEFEVVVVNDGSTDNTLAELMSAFRLVKTEKPVRLITDHAPIVDLYLSFDYPNLIVVDKEHGGRADALNAGINVSTYPIFCSVDSSSVLENEALLRAARLFVEDREVVAAGSIVRVLNGCRIEQGVMTRMNVPEQPLARFQAVEYTRNFLSSRAAWNGFGGLLSITGAFGIFRKDIAQAVNGYQIGEDMDLIVRMHGYCREEKIAYKIAFVPNPICFTRVPVEMGSLLQQRERGQRGLIKSLIASRHMFLKGRYGNVGLFSLPYFLFAEALGPIIELCAYLGFLLCYLSGNINNELALLFLLIAVFWTMWINISAVLLDNILYKRYENLPDVLLLCGYGVLELCGYRQLIGLGRVLGTLQFWRK